MTHSEIIFNIIIVLICCFIIAIPASSQSQQSYNPFLKKMEKYFQDPSQLEEMALQPLPLLIEAAVKHSPLIKGQALRLDNLEQEAKLQGMKWTDYINVGGSVTSGNGQFFDAIQTVENNSYRLTDRRNLVYSTGVSVRIPLSVVFTGGPQQKIASNNLEIEKMRQEEIEQGIRRRVIGQYNAFVLAVKLMKIKAKDLEYNPFIFVWDFILVKW